MIKKFKTKFKIHKSWYSLFENNLDVIVKILSELPSKDISPKPELMFKAFETDLANVKMVIVGQDPYPNAQLATGNAFAVPQGKTSESLKEIEKYANQYGIKLDYTLQNWMDNGILLLNAAYTTKSGSIGTHRSLWEPFTKLVYDYIVKHNPECMIIALGSVAKNAAKGIVPKDKFMYFPHPAANVYSNQELFNKEFFTQTEQYANWNNFHENV